MVLISHLGALVIALLLPLPVGLTAGIAALAGASLFWHWRHGVLAAGEWRLTEDGSCFASTTAGDAASSRHRVTRALRYPGIVFLLLEGTDRHRRRLLIAYDAVDPDIFRALCARIVQHRLPAPDSADL